MKSRLLGGIAALVLAIVGAVLLMTYVNGADARAQKSLDPVQVLVAAKEIPAGTEASELEEYLEAKQLPQAAVAPGALTDLEDAGDKVLASGMVPGEQLLEAKLVAQNEVLTPGTIAVPKGLQEVTVVLEPERVVGGKLRAGDSVGVFGNYTVKEKNNPDAEEEKITKLLDDEVLITAIQIAPSEQTSTADGTAALPSGSAYITFGTTSAQAAKIIHSQEFGSLWLTKQNDDTKKGDSKVWDINEVLK